MVGIPPFYSKNKQVMYRKILMDEPMFPASVSPEFKHLIEGLLQKSPNNRFGPAEIRASGWFADTNWEAVDAKQIPPPIQPKVADPTSTDMFDSEFTSQVA